MRKPYVAFGLIILFFCLWCVAHASVVYLKTFNFNDGKALNKWKSMIINGKVTYRLVQHDDGGHVNAVSEKACSALYYRIGYKLKEYPYLRWKWRVLQFPDKSRAKTDEEKDDYAARVYVIFPFLSFSSSKFIEYVWAENLPVGTILDSPDGKNIKMVVVRSGKEENSEWVVDTRNVYEDYISVFGQKPRRKVGAIAIMCDADSTKTLAESLFDDIMIEKVL